MSVKRGLGRGLDTLFLNNDIDNSSSESKQLVSISKIEPNKNQPRKVFDENMLLELSQSIQLHGLIQPIVVRPLPNGFYQIIAGERRWRASKLAGLKEIEVIIKNFDDEQTYQIAMIENLQREDLNPIEEANGYKSLIERFNMTQDEVSKILSKPRSHIANSLRLLNLPDETIELISNSKISKGHGKVLLSLDDEKLILKLSKEIVEKNLSVRQLENIIKTLNSKLNYNAKDNVFNKNSFFTETEILLSDILSTNVKIKESKNKKYLEIEFFSESELEFILNKLSDKS